ncbi:uncharacterized protein LOC122945564 [Bufo gargarizans]|uniref:uncharacterized protein LOC122945564 n=1 Tax=Bufo gargarizans TaxID=30331 RepID=UPI001CF2F8F9|nr:uncharacterized protein LOC122945564 [Bufo gargarizans]
MRAQGYTAPPILHYYWKSRTPPKLQVFTTAEICKIIGAVIFSSEEDNGVKILQSWTKRFINDCQLINPSTITNDEDWRPDVEKSPIVIFYSSSSMSSIEKMKSYMENNVSRKGHQAVIVVIRDIQDSEEKVRSELGISWYSECELHVFTKTEWLLQDPRQQVMAMKIKTIRDCLPGGSQKMNLNKEPNNLNTSQNSKNGATFFIQETTQEKSHWLEPVLRTIDKVDFTVTEISKIKKLSYKAKEIGPISCILHFNKETFHKMTKKENSGETVIDRKILQHLGKKVQTVVVVVDDVDDDGSEDGLRALYNKTRLSRSAPLVVFRREEKQEEFLAYFSSNNDAEVAAQEKWSKLQKSIETRVKAPPETEKTEVITKFTTVGIFSRSSNIDYSWMDKMLMSPDLHLPISGVRSFCISNNQTQQIFEELNLCTFGILYHTKNRGRVNVTDVTDSLYDEELKDMSYLLGRNNVIVVIDDLTDNSLEEKNRILKSQPSIKEYAYNLLLVTEKEKKDEPRLLERLREALMFKGKEKDCRETVEENSTSQPGDKQPSSGEDEKSTLQPGDKQPSSGADEKSTSQSEDKQPSSGVEEKSTSQPIAPARRKKTDPGDNQMKKILEPLAENKQPEENCREPVEKNSTSQPEDKQPSSGADEKSTLQPEDKQPSSAADEKSTLQPGDNKPSSGADEKSTLQPGDNKPSSGADEKSTSQPEDKQPSSGADEKSTSQPGDNQTSSGVDEKSTSQPGDKQPSSGADEKSTSQPEDKQPSSGADEKSTLQPGDNKPSSGAGEKSTSQPENKQPSSGADEKNTSQPGDKQPSSGVEEKSTFQQPIAPAKKKKTDPGDDQMKKILEPLAENKQPEESKNNTNKNVSKSEGKVSNRDSEKKAKSKRHSKKEPESIQDPQKELTRDSKKEPESKQDSENDQHYYSSQL